MTRCTRSLKISVDEFSNGKLAVRTAPWHSARSTCLSWTLSAQLGAENVSEQTHEVCAKNYSPRQHPFCQIGANNWCLKALRLLPPNGTHHGALSARPGKPAGLHVIPLTAVNPFLVAHRSCQIRCLTSFQLLKHLFSHLIEFRRCRFQEVIPNRGIPDFSVILNT